MILKLNSNLNVECRGEKKKLSRAFGGFIEASLQAVKAI